MGSSLNIGSPTIGGGTAFQAILADMLGLISQDTKGRADVGLGLFGGLLESELSARRRPVSILDQLFLAQEFGTQLPLSQLPPERSRALGIREPNPLLGDLRESLGNFATGRDDSFESFWDAFNQDFTFTDRSDPRGRWRAATQFVERVGIEHVPEIARRVREAGHDELGRNLLKRFAGEGGPKKLQAGGSFTVVPGQKQSGGNSVAGPVRMIDATGRNVAIAGEGTSPETIRVTPQRGAAATAATAGTDVLPRDLPPDPNLARDIRFRMEAIFERAPLVGLQGAIDIATKPGVFESFMGRQGDPRTQASQALGGALSADLRFTDPFVRALALGRGPTVTEITAGDVSGLTPDFRDVLASIVGEDLFPSFLFELGMFSPTGTRVRQGAVAGLRV